MRLSDDEKRVLRIVELDAELSAAEVARRIGLKTYSVQRILRRLIDRQVIAGRTAVIDICRLGLIEFGVNISIAPKDLKQRSSFLKMLKQELAISWIAETGGPFDFMINVVARSPHEVLGIMHRVLADYPRFLIQKQTCQRTTRMRFNRGLFGPRTDLRPRFTLGQALELSELDNVDYRILRILSQSKFEAQRTLAQAAEVSLTTFLRRLERLKREKILCGFGYRMNLDQIDIQQFRILLSFKTISAKLREQMIRFAGQHGEIKLLVECLGAWDYELEVDIDRLASIKTLISALHQTFYDELTEINNVPIFKHEKFISFPPGNSK